MLKYQFKIKKDSDLKLLNPKELFLSKDLSYISGITNYDEDIVNGEEVFVSSPHYLNSVKRTIEVKTVKRQGYVLTKEKYPIKKISNVGENNKDVYYVEYNGNYYYRFKTLIMDCFLIEDKIVQRNVDGTVTIPTKHWIEDNKVIIKGETYEVDMSLIPNKNFVNGYEFPTIKKLNGGSILEKVDGSDIDILDYEYDKWVNINKFIIHNNKPNDIIVTGATHASEYPFVTYHNEVYPLISQNNGFGAYIDDKLCLLPNAYNLDDFAKIENPKIEYNGTELLVETTLKKDDDGQYLVLFTEIENIPFSFGDTLVAENNNLFTYETVNKDENGNLYVIYKGEKYQVIKNICDNIEINKVEYKITYTDDSKTTGYIIIENQKIMLSFENVNGIKKAKIKNKVYYLNNKNLVEFGLEEPKYIVNEISGITLSNGITCPILKKRSDEDSTDDTLDNFYCEIKGIESFELTISQTKGSQMLVCLPLLPYEKDNVYERKNITSTIVDNISDFKFHFKSTLFGKNKITPLTKAEESLNSDHPISTENVSQINNNLKIYQLNKYITLPLGIGVNVDPTVNKENTIQHNFVKDVKNNYTNDIVDMEKDVYYPALNDNDNFKAIEELVFNLHFRTRDLEAWKIIQDDTTELGKANGNILTYSNNAENSNWFVTDFYDYKKLNDLDSLQNSSDLIGLLNFSDDDISFRKKSIAKSFLRLSFYSTTNPNTQVLLSTSTIFMDENRIFKKMMDNKIHRNDKFKEIELKSKIGDVQLSNKINVMSELYDIYNKKIIIDTDKRLDSSFIVKDKNNTDNSSEGFYLYLFREYSTKLRQGTIYLKIDFCHAGNGLVIPFIIPKSSDTGSILYLNNFDDVREMKEGVPLDKLYDNLYIPIHVVYSEKDKKYWYYLPSEYVENNNLGLTNDNDNKMIFNLFELKIKNQSYETDL